MPIRILFLDDSTDRVNRFREVTVAQVWGAIMGSSDPRAVSFLNRNPRLEIELSAMNVGNGDAQISAANERAVEVLLLDCKLAQGARPSSILAVLPVIDLSCRRVCVLTTSHEDAVALLGHVGAPLRPLVIAGTPCITPADAIVNIVDGVLHWEACQSGSKYDTLVRELLGSWNAGYSKHPGEPPNRFDHERRDLWTRHFQDGPVLWHPAINSILYDLANSTSPDGIDLRSAWVLAQLKFWEVFPDAEYPFQPYEEEDWNDRWAAATLPGRPFVGAQQPQHRAVALLAYGRMCEMLFKHKTTLEKSLRSATLMKIPVDGGVRHKMTWMCDWPVGPLLENIREANDAIVRAYSAAPAGGWVLPQHNSSRAVVAFLLSASVTTPDHESLWVNGYCFTLKISGNGDSTTFEFCG